MHLNKSMALVLIIFLLNCNLVYGFDITGIAGIVQNSGDVKYVAKREIVLSKLSFEKVFFDVYYSKPQNVEQWLKSHNASDKLISFCNSSSQFDNDLYNGLQTFDPGNYSIEERIKLSQIEELKHFMKKYNHRNSLSKKILRGTGYVIILPLLIIGYTDQYSSGNTFINPLQDAYDLFLKKNKSAYIPIWLFRGYQVENIANIKSSLLATQEIIVKHAVSIQKTDFNGVFKFQNIDNGIYYISLITPTQISVNDLFWDVQATVNNKNIKIDLENSNINEKILNYFKLTGKDNL